jgi:ribosomal-protein-alanine N-acetyltransferase
VTGYQFVPCSAAHTPLLAEMHAACFPKSWSAGEFVGLLSTPGASATIVTIDTAGADPGGADPGGFILWRCAADEAEIITLGVIPQHRGKGLGALLANDAMQRAGRSAKAMFLEVAEGNHLGRRLYEGLGFTESGRRRNYYKSSTHSIDAIIYRRSIG